MRKKQRFARVQDRCTSSRKSNAYQITKSASCSSSSSSTMKGLLHREKEGEGDRTLNAAMRELCRWERESYSVEKLIWADESANEVASRVMRRWATRISTKIGDSVLSKPTLSEFYTQIEGNRLRCITDETKKKVCNIVLLSLWARDISFAFILFRKKEAFMRFMKESWRLEEALEELSLI